MDIPVQNLAELMTDGAPNVTGRNRDVPSLITNVVREEHSRSGFDNTPLLDTTRKSECETGQNDECSYSGFKTR
jgi:hypothetical protein